MASISANGSKGHHRFTLNVNETGTNAGANQSTVSFSLVLSPIQNDWDWNVSRDPVTYNINIDGSLSTNIDVKGINDSLVLNYHSPGILDIISDACYLIQHDTVISAIQYLSDIYRRYIK